MWHCFANSYFKQVILKVWMQTVPALFAVVTICCAIHIVGIITVKICAVWPSKPHLRGSEALQFCNFGIICFLACQCVTFRGTFSRNSTVLQSVSVCTSEYRPRLHFEQNYWAKPWFYVLPALSGLLHVKCAHRPVSHWFQLTGLLSKLYGQLLAFCLQYDTSTERFFLFLFSFFSLLQSLEVQDWEELDRGSIQHWSRYSGFVFGIPTHVPSAQRTIQSYGTWYQC